MPRIYHSFDELEQTELRKLDHLYGSIDEMVDQLLLSELDDLVNERTYPLQVVADSQD